MSCERRKVLILVRHFKFLFSHRKELVSALLDAGYEVHLAGSGELPKKLDKRLRVHTCDLDSTELSLLREMRSLFQVLKIFTVVKPDLVHLLTFKAHLYGLLTAFVCSTPIKIVAFAGLGHLATLPSRSVKYLFVERVYRYLCGTRHLYAIVQNERDFQKAVSSFEINSNRVISTMGSGVNLDVFSPAPNNPISRRPVCLFVGRLLRSKGVDSFVRVAEALVAEDLEFRIIGDIDLSNPESLTEADVDDLRSNSALVYQGHSDSVEKELIKADIFLYPSRYGEGIAKVLLEAAACGVPVVTTTNPGCVGAIVDGVTGLALPEDDIDGMVRSVLKISRDGELRGAMSKAAREHAQNNFDVNSVVKEHLELYEVAFSHYAKR